MTPTLLGRNGQPAESRVERHAEPGQGPPPGPAAEAAPLPAAPAPAGRLLAAFCFDPPDGYVGGHARQLLTALAGRGTAVHLFCRHAFEAPGVHVHVLGESPSAGLLDQVEAFATQAADAFRQLFPAAPGGATLLGFEWSAAGPLLALGGWQDFRTVLSLHSLERQRGDLIGELSQRIAGIELAALRQCSAVLVQDPGTAEVARHWLPECAPRLVGARPVFPAHRFEAELDPGAVKARYQVGPVDPTILYVGDLSEPYGPDLLLKAMPAVLKNHKQARLVVVGFGDLYWPLRVYARYLLLEHAVRLPGNVEGKELDELVRAADVVAVPSRSSTPWWPIQAAWAAGRPVVATHAAAPQLVEHEQDAVLCYPTENSLVWGLERVLYDPDFARGLAARGRRKLEQRFGWNLRAEQVEELMTLTGDKVTR